MFTNKTITKLAKATIASAILTLSIGQNNISFAHINKTKNLENFQPIAEFSALEILKDREVTSKPSLDSSEFTFKNRYTDLDLYQQESGKLAFNATRYSEDFQNYEHVHSKLDHLDLNFDAALDEEQELDLELDIAVTNNTVYAHVYNYKCHMYSSPLPNTDHSDVTTCYSYLLKSTDGVNWEKAYTFTNKWKSIQLSATDYNLYIQYSTERPTRSDYFFTETHLTVFNTNTNTFEDLALPKRRNGDDQTVSQILTTNDKVFIKTYDTGSYPEPTEDNMYFRDATDTSNNWTKVEHVQDLVKNTEEGEASFELTYIFNIKKLGDYYLAEAWYRPKELSSSREYQSVYLVSKDNGVNWSILNLQLDNQYVHEITKINNSYHILSDDKDDRDSDSDTDSDDDSTETAEDIVKFLKSRLTQSSVNHYVISEEQFNNNELLNLKPSYVYNNVNLINTTKNTTTNTSVFNFVYVKDDNPMFGFFHYTN